MPQKKNWLASTIVRRIGLPVLARLILIACDEPNDQVEYPVLNAKRD